MMIPTFAFAVAPVLAAMIGAALTLWRRPSDQVVSAIQHFAAGVVFAAAASEVLPRLKHSGSIWPIIIGGTCGILLMMVIQGLEGRQKGNIGLFSAIAVDIFIDGLVLGLSFIAGQTQGLLLTIALTIEVLFLGLTVAVAFKAGRWQRVLGTTLILVLMLPVGMVVAAPIALLSAPVITAFFAFSLIALLYLVTEELLVEAHEVPDRPWISAMFFVGFLLLLLLADLME